MHYYKTIQVNTLAIFLQEIERLKNKGYELVYTGTGKGIVFDGKNTCECQASVSAILKAGTATLTIVCEI